MNRPGAHTQFWDTLFLNIRQAQNAFPNNLARIAFPQKPFSSRTPFY
jgi:hypothetical protein